MSLMSWLSVFVAAGVLHLQCKCAWETGRKRELQTEIHVALWGRGYCSLALIPKKLKRMCSRTHTQRYSYTHTRITKEHQVPFRMTKLSEIKKEIAWNSRARSRELYKMKCLPRRIPKQGLRGSTKEERPQKEWGKQALQLKVQQIKFLCRKSLSHTFRRLSNLAAYSSANIFRVTTLGNKSKINTNFRSVDLQIICI